MPLLDLPQELLLQIATHIKSIRNIYHLALVSRLLGQIFESEIDKRDALDQYGAELLRYAAEGNQDGILKMISLGADINFRPPDCLRGLKTALHAAIEANNIELVKFLLENGAQPNFVLKSQRYLFSPLHMAIETTTSNDLVVLNLLLDYGANPNLCDTYQRPPLLVAVQTKHLQKMELLVARGADVNYRGRLGTTPLHKCIENGGHRIEFLIEKGSELNCVDDWN